jgi:hypothetical protein
MYQGRNNLPLWLSWVVDKHLRIPITHRSEIWILADSLLAARVYWVYSTAFLLTICCRLPDHFYNFFRMQNHRKMA